MTSVIIVEIEVFGKRDSRFWDGFVGLQVHFLVFDGAPKAFDKHIIPPASLAIHADIDRVGLQDAGEGLRGELRPPGRC